MIRAPAVPNLIRFAIVGCGAIGRRHGDALLAMPDVSITRAMDTDADKAAAAAEAWTTTGTTEIDEALLTDDVDAVVIATPHDSHTDLAVRAAKARKHLFLEKPVALRYTDALRVQAAIDQARVIGAVDFSFRAAPAVTAAQAQVPSPRIVRLVAVSASLAGSWRGEAVHGGVIADIGGHVFDLACFLVGSAPQVVYAMGGRVSRRAGLPDTLAATIGFANGAFAQVIVGEFGPAAHTSKWWGVLSDGTRTATLFERLTTLEIREPGRSPRRVVPMADARTNHARTLAAFVGAIRDEGRPIASIADGVRAVRLADAAYESMGIGRTVDVRGD